jgi:3alpha(or 20beta)-hydroxysteroid dehydrogenase
MTNLHTPDSLTPATGRFAGKVAIISGGARGQGASHAERLASEGASVLCGDVLDDVGEAMVAGLRRRDLAVHYQHLDVTSVEDWAAAIVWATDRHGRLDLLVNNAGIIHVNPITEEHLDDWNRTMAVNVTGTLLGIQAAIPLMRQTGGGSIVNISSIFGVNGSEGYIAYTASKGAILAMTKTAALELATDKIRVNTICPGGVSTPMNDGEPEGGVVPLTPLGRRAAVHEISGAVAFLASEDAAFITGTELVVDGGYLAR